MFKIGAFLRKLFRDKRFENVAVFPEQQYVTKDFLRNYLGIDEVRLSFSRVNRFIIGEGLFTAFRLEPGYNFVADVTMVDADETIPFSLPYIEADNEQDAISEALTWIAIRIEEFQNQQVKFLDAA